MSDWIDINNKQPKESDDLWYEIKKGDEVIKYPARYWEWENGACGDFVNAAFGKTEGITHYRAASN